MDQFEEHGVKQDGDMNIKYTKNTDLIFLRCRVHKKVGFKKNITKHKFIMRNATSKRSAYNMLVENKTTYYEIRV